MDGDGIIHTNGVAAGQHNRHWNSITERGFDHQPVAVLQTVECERKAAELILIIWVGPGNVNQEVRMESGDWKTVGRAEPVEIFLVIDAVGEMNIHGRRRLPQRVVVVLVNGKSENGGVAGENRSRAIPVMDVAIDNHGTLD